MRANSTQTTLSTVTHTGVQTRSTAATSSAGGNNRAPHNRTSLAPTGGVLASLLVPRTGNGPETDAVLELVGDDIVVDYASDGAVLPCEGDEGGDDTNSSCAMDQQEGEAVDEDDAVLSDNEVVSFGHAQVSLPRRRQASSSSPSPTGRRQSPSPSSSSPRVVLVPSNVDAEEAARAVARLSKELDELRVSSTLREKELHSIVENCRSAIKGELEGERRRREEEYAKTVAGLERSMQQLKDIIAKRDETVREKQMQLNHQAELIDEARRERDRYWKVIEGDLRSECARLLRDKEKLRFDIEVMQNRSSSSDLSRTTLEVRAHDAECRWLDASKRACMATEDAQRAALEAHAVEVLEGVVAAAVRVQRLDDYHTLRSEDRWQRILALLEPALQYNGHEGLKRLLEVSAAPKHDLDPLVDQDITTAAAEVTIHELIHKRAVAWRERQVEEERDAAAREALLHTLQDGLAAWNDQVDTLAASTQHRVQQLGAQCDTFDRVLHVCSSKVASHTTERARGRATTSVLDNLVEEHATEMHELSQQLKTTQQELEDAKRRNMIEEAFALRGKTTALEADKAALTRTVATLQGQVRALESACREMESGASEHVVKVQHVAQELADVRARAASSDSELRRTIANLQTAAAAHEKDQRRLQHQVQEATDAQTLLQRRIEVLVQQHQALKDKFVADKTEEVVARVNRRLSSEASMAAAQQKSGLLPPADAAEMERLQQRVLLLRRENDALTQRLDSALAEASHAEEQREHALKRNLAMMSLEDAAPKREQLILSQQAALEATSKRLDEKEQLLMHRALDLERRMAQLNSHGGGTGYVAAVGAGPKRHGAEGSASSNKTPRTPSDTCVMGGGGGSAGSNKAIRLAPITLRPAHTTGTAPSSTGSSRTDNPQKYSPPPPTL